ncbi:helix-turn-helix domain-containing protein [Haloarculaceae archaeon H-GB2-1]|nr:helix-turn-helix domain-containing protein [Haloarculaceae archaeon H-GB1-1]MEA5388434.1 helix-turn-helix domain-containing protein [Haloarculaceae archaeon H-GB11]MEA5406470.1 helix-turn-helix domain-containing protein [Haloarculaceae archaeon H-GB2-1]
MSHIAELTVKHPNLVLTPTLEAIPDLEVRVESQPITVAESPTLFYMVRAPDFRAFEDELVTDHTVDGWAVDGVFDSSRIYKITFSETTRFLTPQISDIGLRILDATSVEGGWHLRVHTPTRKQLERFLSYCRDEDVQCHLEKVFSTADDSGPTTGERIDLELTDRQREVAQTATEMGYFGAGGASADEVAAELDIAPSTLSSHLRTITEKVFARLFGGES